jgi:prophage regulatory protein
MTHDQIPGLITMTEVLAITAIRSRTTIYRLSRQGRFPRPRSFGTGRIRWLEQEVRDWVAALPLQEYPGGHAADSYGLTAPTRKG